MTLKLITPSTRPPEWQTGAALICFRALANDLLKGKKARPLAENVEGLNLYLEKGAALAMSEAAQEMKFDSAKSDRIVARLSNREHKKLVARGHELLVALVDDSRINQHRLAAIDKTALAVWELIDAVIDPEAENKGHASVTESLGVKKQWQTLKPVLPAIATDYIVRVGRAQETAKSNSLETKRIKAKLEEVPSILMSLHVTLCSNKPHNAQKPYLEQAGLVRVSESGVGILSFVQ